MASRRRRNPGILDPLYVAGFVEDHPITTLVGVGALVLWVTRTSQVQAVGAQRGVAVPNPPTWLTRLFGQNQPAPAIPNARQQWVGNCRTGAC